MFSSLTISNTGIASLFLNVLEFNIFQILSVIYFTGPRCFRYFLSYVVVPFTVGSFSWFIRISRIP